MRSEDFDIKIKVNYSVNQLKQNGDNIFFYIQSLLMKTGGKNIKNVEGDTINTAGNK